MALARAAFTGEEHVLASFDEAQGGEALDKRAVELGLEGPVEALQGLSHAQSAAEDAPLDASFALFPRRFPQHALKQLQVGRFLRLRPTEVGFEL